MFIKLTEKDTLKKFFINVKDICYFYEVNDGIRIVLHSNERNETNNININKRIFINDIDDIERNVYKQYYKYGKVYRIKKEI